MRLYEGIVLVARCKSNEKNVKNGVRYQVRAIPEEDDDQHMFEIVAVNYDDQGTGDSSIMLTADIGNNIGPRTYGCQVPSH